MGWDGMGKEQTNTEWGEDKSEEEGRKKMCARFTSQAWGLEAGLHRCREREG